MNTTAQSVRVAVIQASPVYLDIDGCLGKVRRLVAQAASKGATITAFGECWLPGYPVHALVGMETPGWWDFAIEYLEKAIDIPGPETQALCDIARAFQVDLVIGVAERDHLTRGTIYSTQLIIGAEGEITSRHRKLRPAINERSVFADGDAAGLQVFDRGYGQISGLLGCDHQMVLPTYALAELGTQFHVASWPGGDAPAPAAPAALYSRQLLLSRAFAAQTSSYVLCASGILSPEDLPAPYRDFLREPFTGNSAIIDPRGEVCAGPVTGETIVYTNCSLPLIRSAKVAFDCAGHSGRADQLEFRNHGVQDQGNDMQQGGYVQEGYDQDPDGGNDDPASTQDMSGPGRPPNAGRTPNR